MKVLLCGAGFRLNKGFYPVLAEKGYGFARGGGRGPYVPERDNRFGIPTFGIHNNVLKGKDYFAAVAKQATAGQVVVLTFHGVPDVEHPWTGTDPENFEACMKFLNDNQYTVLSMRDLVQYVDVTQTASK